jgi:hypothetical protein
MKINCPNCKSTVKIKEVFVGRIIRCKICRWKGKINNVYGSIDMPNGELEIKFEVE